MTLTPSAPVSAEQWRSHVAEVLTRARNRSQLLTESVDDDDLVRQHSPLMSPLVWDLAHVGNQEELWLVRDVGGRTPVRQDIDELYERSSTRASTARARGDLFEEITRLPEYYPTRAERSILVARAAEIARRTRAHTLVELGSGSSEKTRLLLDSLQAEGTSREFVPLDVSEAALRDAVAGLSDDYPALGIHGVVGDFTEHLGRLPGQTPRIVAFLGGTIGNLFPDERAAFLAELRETLVDGEWLLLGTDLVKDPDVLVQAYDDSAGVTAEFNRNVLAVLNRQLGADFDILNYEHVAIWDPDNEWIEMRLRSTAPARVTLSELDLGIVLIEGTSSRFRSCRVNGVLTCASPRTCRALAARHTVCRFRGTGGTRDGGSRWWGRSAPRSSE